MPEACRGARGPPNQFLIDRELLVRSAVFFGYSSSTASKWTAIMRAARGRQARTNILLPERYNRLVDDPATDLFYDTCNNCWSVCGKTLCPRASRNWTGVSACKA